MRALQTGQIPLMQERLLQAIPQGQLVSPMAVERAVPGVSRSTVYRNLDALAASGVMVRVFDPNHPTLKLYRRTDGPAPTVTQALHSRLGLTAREHARVLRITRAAARSTVVVYAVKDTFDFVLQGRRRDRDLEALLRARGMRQLVGYYRQRRGQSAETLRDLVVEDLRACRLLEGA